MKAKMTQFKMSITDKAKSDLRKIWNQGADKKAKDPQKCFYFYFLEIKMQVLNASVLFIISNLFPTLNFFVLA